MLAVPTRERNPKAFVPAPPYVACVSHEGQSIEALRTYQDAQDRLKRRLDGRFAEIKQALPAPSPPTLAKKASMGQL
jgi:hypothetical protein